MNRSSPWRPPLTSRGHGQVALEQRLLDRPLPVGQERRQEPAGQARARGPGRARRTRRSPRPTACP